MNSVCFLMSLFLLYFWGVGGGGGGGGVAGQERRGFSNFKRKNISSRERLIYFIRSERLVLSLIRSGY